ncbi:MAG: transposase zinc-binding domain-containing protein [Candidatus Riflebacteria bacterium]|nr:transposase zinc-binding domain-containing protein [Candidatus Riflebacteria bacterium]
MIPQNTLQYLDCGDLHNGFARVKCGGCGHEFLVPFTCKRRNFCPSCHQKRVIEFGEFLCTSVLKKVPHLHVVFSLPKILRRYFLYDRKLLADLSRCAWETLSLFLKTAAPDENPVPGAVVAVQTFGDFLAFHPHCHILSNFLNNRKEKFVAPQNSIKKLQKTKNQKTKKNDLKV